MTLNFIREDTICMAVCVWGCQRKENEFPFQSIFENDLRYNVSINIILFKIPPLSLSKNQTSGLFIFIYVFLG